LIIYTYSNLFLQGFPPKVIETNDETLLTTLGIRSGDTLLADKLSQTDQQVPEPVCETRILKPTSDPLLAQASQGILTRKVVPANNSCLFTSIDFLIEERTSVNLDCEKAMRELIATIVQTNKDTYSSAILGKSNKDYCKWIKSSDSWGGAIEIAILSQCYSIEIDVVDTQSGRIDRFGEDQDYSHRILIIYDGIHYDALVLESLDPSRLSYRHKFPTLEHSILIMAQELANEAKSSRQFTDVNQFSLRCLVCQKCLKGQTEAQLHAKNTGHINFGEV